MYNVNMVKKVLDIFAVQNSQQELSYAVEHIGSDDVVVFENATIRLKIGEKIIKDKLFNVAIFSEESDVMILVDKFSSVSKEEVFDELKIKDIQYHLVSFLPDEIQKFEQNTPDLWFARETQVLKAACDDTKKKTDNLTYKFERFKQAELTFEFLTNSNTKTTFTHKIKFSGLIHLEDKLVLITTSNNIQAKHEKFEKILERKGFVEANSHII